MRKFAIFLLCLFMMLSLCLPACASMQHNSGDELKEEVYLSQEEMQSIIEAFPNEVEYFLSKHDVDLTAMTASEFDIVKRSAAIEICNPEYRFSEFVTEISNVRAQKRIERVSNQRGHTIENLIDVPYRSYGPLKGEYIDAIAASISVTKSSSFSFDVGTEIRGIDLGLSFQAQRDVTIMGPNSTDKLPNGLSVTHHIFMSVLFGTIRYTEYDVVTPVGTTHCAYYYIDEESDIIHEYALQAAITERVYVKCAASDVVLGYNSTNHLINAIVETPETLILRTY